MSVKQVALINVVIVCVGTFGVAAAAQEAGEPKLVLSQDSWDFGTIFHLEKREFVLTVTNAGAGELRISQVKSSCGCTLTQLEKDVLQPGESTPIKITFNSKLKDGQTEARLTICSNDKANPEQPFHITGFVKHLVEVTPKHGLLFRALEPDAAQTQTVRLVNKAEEPLRPTLQPFLSGNFAAELKEVEPGKEYVVTVTTQPPFEQRTLADTLEIATGLKDEPRVELSTQFMIVDRVNLLPPAVLTKATGDKPVYRTVRIQYFGSDPRFRVTGVTCADPAVKLRLGLPQPPPKSDRQWLLPYSIVTLTLEFPPDTVYPPEGLECKIKTNDPEYPELTFRATPDRALYSDLNREGRTTSQRKTAP